MVREAWEPSNKVMLLSAQAMKCLSLLPSFLKATPNENSVTVNDNDDDGDGDGDDDDGDGDGDDDDKASSWLKRLVAGLPSRHRSTIFDQSMRDLW